VDRVVSEPVDPADDPVTFCRRIGQVLQHEIASLMHMPDDTRVAARLERYDRLG
jgi:acetyl-CoA carboxylase carboxyl transferase subunit beta